MPAVPHLKNRLEALIHRMPLPAIRDVVSKQPSTGRNLSHCSLQLFRHRAPIHADAFESEIDVGELRTGSTPWVENCAIIE